MWTGLPHRNISWEKREREKAQKQRRAEVAALDPNRVMTPDSMSKWKPSDNGLVTPSEPTPEPTPRRALPAPWDPPKRSVDFDLTMDVAPQSPTGRKPKQLDWDAEMMEMGSTATRAALKGSCSQLVEQRNPLVKPRRQSSEVHLYHEQLPSPSRSRGSGFEALAAGGKAPVRYNLQLDGKRPFMAGSYGHSRAFAPIPGFLPQRDQSLWDQERCTAPERAYAAPDNHRRGNADCQDDKRRGLPAWKPGGRKKVESPKMVLDRTRPGAQSQPNLRTTGRGQRQDGQLVRAATSLLKL
mmetsp:Transcript_51823/g.93044  ORF Transcript_51823/g.93044 Transcript_51823/m.93044 type:complete len:297 (+) Transcript_51823:70-960(+)|eukprot:CAMPEP_0197662736 /NCGR_PEP_ID=MMETSP1338-20131121/54574_1 /TAXON_ID=43686 ORGANISM="Pelagodinium beii, Strain RCC1491" /NCGR_SAMPLE_ID=MMETSP1338 /ASSEMBLY_ACC=CAM_ASM_000754 /LENGTH=296 /DNA_ID=CAMNT_0043240709 /DNA_START=65 /DNA_END=955 /DNA_ORIENTATION=-